MCDPITATVIAVAGATASTVGQIQQSKAMAKAINRQSEQQAEEIRDQASAAMFDNAVETFDRIGLSRVAGAQRGLNDASRTLELATNALLFDYEFDNARIQKNQENAQKARVAETQSRLASASRPTMLGAGLQIISAGTQAYGAAGGFKKED